MRSLDVAQHEAAHVVVGVAMGLRLRKAVIGHDWLGATPVLGYTWFASSWKRSRLAYAVMIGAGAAYERAQGTPFGWYDENLVRRIVRSKHDVEAAVRSASAVLHELGASHVTVARALLERDLSGRDIEALARGEPLENDD